MTDDDGFGVRNGPSSRRLEARLLCILVKFSGSLQDACPAEAAKRILLRARRSPTVDCARWS